MSTCDLCFPTSHILDALPSLQLTLAVYVVFCSFSNFETLTCMDPKSVRHRATIIRKAEPNSKNNKRMPTIRTLSAPLSAFAVMSFLITSNGNVAKAMIPPTIRSTFRSLCGANAITSVYTKCLSIHPHWITAYMVMQTIPSENTPIRSITMGVSSNDGGIATTAMKVTQEEMPKARDKRFARRRAGKAVSQRS